MMTFSRLFLIVQNQQVIHKHSKSIKCCSDIKNICIGNPASVKKRKICELKYQLPLQIAAITAESISWFFSPHNSWLIRKS